jgi:hypothetical protein
MNVATLVRYLVGRRDAIQEVAASRNAIWVGLVFVLSAGLAREYDGADLLHEPWHLLIPLAASLATSLLLWAMVRRVLRVRGDGPTLFPNYRGFLGLYWLTAPLAWLYAIPVERFMSVPVAVAANLWLLGIVALWRVLLMSRVVSVLCGWRLWAGFVVVMLFADLVTMAILWLTPLPVFDLMGGIRLTESEQIIQGTAFMVGFLGVITLPVWFMASTFVAWRRRLGAATVPENSSAVKQRISLGLWTLCAASLLVWSVFIRWTQPEQQNRRHVERLMRDAKTSEGVAYMSARERVHFPPHWEPPPRIGYGERTPPLVEVFDAIASQATANWVTSLYVDKVVFHGDDFVPWRGPALDISAMNDEQLSRFVKLVESLPERGPELAATFRVQLMRKIRSPHVDDAPLPASDTERRKLLDRLLALAHEHDDGPATLEEMIYSQSE